MGVTAWVTDIEQRDRQKGMKTCLLRLRQGASLQVCMLAATYVLLSPSNSFGRL